MKKFKVKIDIDKDVMVRQVNPKEDLLFIFNSWLKSYRNSDFAMHIPTNDYYTNHHHLIKTIITQPNNNITILCDPEDPNHILGYSVYNSVEPILYYIYVKHSFRNLGLGRYLLESVRKNFGEVTLQCTHKNKNWRKVKKLELSYNPYLIKELSYAESKTDTNKTS